MATSLSELLSSSSAQDIVVQALRDSGYSGDLSPGSPLYQLLVDPHAAIYAMNVGAQDALRNSWSLLSRDPQSSVDIDQQALVHLFSNLRLTPSAGARAKGRVQLTFTNADVRTVTKATQFISTSGAVFQPDNNYTLVPEESYRSSFSPTEIVYTRTARGYAVDIGVDAGLAGRTSISNGEVFTTNFPGVVSCVASTAFTSGKDVQSVADLVRDIPEILSETSMASPISLTSFLYQNFPDIQGVRVFRSGNAEMRRSFNNALGIATPAADVVVMTSARPSTSRQFLPGYVELFINPSNKIYNGEHDLGFADMVEMPLAGYVWVEASISSPELTGMNHVFSAGVRKPDTDPGAISDPDTNTQPGLSILGRTLVTDSRYSNLPVMGSDPRDFYLSSYQDRVKFEYRVTWQDIFSHSPDSFEKAKLWLSFWASDDDSERAEIAQRYGASSEDVPRLLRIEVPTYADIVYFSSLRDIQALINNESRRCYGQDYVVKAPHIVSVKVKLTVSKNLDFMIFREAAFRARIAEFINTRGLQHSGTITTEQIKSLVFSDAPRGSDELFEAEFTTSMLLPDESRVTQVNDFISYIVRPEYGITDRNSVFSCSPDQIGIQYL